jgi:ribosome maturation factor RimP
MTTSASGDDRPRVDDGLRELYDGLQEIMALQMDEIRALAERVAASHHLEVVDVEFGGGGKSRALRVFVEKDQAERKKLAERVAFGEVEGSEDLSPLPKGVPVELLSGVTHEDCAAFATDFSTLLDVEDVVPGAEYTLEVSSPGLERKLSRPAEFERFAGSLIKVKTFTPVKDNRLWTGRLIGFAGGVLKMDLAAVKQKGKAKKAAVADVIEIELKNIEKANLVVEI